MQEESLALVEWREARAIIGTADDKLTDLRKYGLGALAALLTAQGLVQVSQGSAQPIIPQSGKLAIILATIILVTVVACLDRIQRSTQRAAALRARVLERQLGMELTDGISDYFRMHWVYSFVDATYWGIIGAVGLLGYLVVDPGVYRVTFDFARLLDMLATAVAVIFVLLVGKDDDPHLIDWTVATTPCSHGERVDIYLTNLSPKDWIEPLKMGPFPVWRLEAPDGSFIDGPPWQRVDKRPLRPGEGCVWTFETKSGTPGPYRLHGAQMVRILRRRRKEWDKWLGSQADYRPLKREVVVDRFRSEASETSEKTGPFAPPPSK